MSGVNLQKQRRYWCKRTVRDEEDMFAEKFNTGLILVFGCISVIISIAMVVNSIAMVIYKQQVITELLKTLIIAGLLLAVGIGSLHFFRTRRRTLAREIALPKELELITCPNPKCHRRIERLIVVSDVSKTPVERYYACPHCFFKLDVVSSQSLREEEKRREDEPTVEKLERKGKAPSGCPRHFGYLASRVKGAPIPQECLICPNVLDCVKGINDSL